MTDSRPSFGHADASAQWEAIARYLADESSTEEAQAVRQWLDEHPADAELVATLDRIADRPSILPQREDVDIESALQGVAARRGEPDVRPLVRPPLRALTRPARGWEGAALRIAAVITVAVVGSLIWYRASHRTNESTALAAAHTYSTGVGQRDSVRLPDGSLAVLGPLSKLVVPVGYGEPARRVDLEGEAFFDVHHDDAHEFTVRTANASINDVGTTFTVSDQGDGARRVRVVVSSGAVLLNAIVGAEGRGVVLHQGDVGTLDRDGQTLVERGRASDEDLAWTRGRLVFREAPLSEVQDELRRWYGIELRIADRSLANRHLTMTFAGESADRVLQVIGLALGGTVERHGDTAVVKAGRGGGR